MTPDEERWAEAGQILKWKGDDGFAYVAERIATLSAAGGGAGAERFESIRSRLDALIHAARA